MEIEEANYILKYFPRLMTGDEHKAKRYYFFSLKLGKPKDYENKRHYELRKDFFEIRNGIDNPSNALSLLKNGYEEFIISTALRIKKETPNQYIINKCPKCKKIARTPYAKQCRYCKKGWHNQVRCDFRVQEFIRIDGADEFWLIGETKRGEVQLGDLIDFTNFQLYFLAEVKKIRDTYRIIDGYRKEFKNLGIDINEEDEKLIKTYIKESPETLMILKK